VKGGEIKSAGKRVTIADQKVKEPAAVKGTGEPLQVETETS